MTRNRSAYLTCEVCNGPFPANPRGPAALTCSPTCRRQRRSRLEADRQRRRRAEQRTEALTRLLIPVLDARIAVALEARAAGTTAA